MSKRPFDLVILDLDGTILDLYRSGDVSLRVRQTIAAVQAAGVPVTISTGRTFDYVRQHVAHLGIHMPVVTTQGAVIGDPVSGRVLVEQDIPLPLARAVAQWIDANPYITAAYFNDAQGRVQIYQNRSGPDLDFYDHVFGNPRTMQPRLHDLVAAAEAHPPLKYLMVNDPDAEDGTGGDLAPELRLRFGPHLYVTRTHPRLVEGTAEGVDKGQGVLHLCRLVGVDPQRVLAIGDSDNDIPMLEAVGLGVAMGNATAGVKAVAGWMAPSIEDDGAAVALQHLILDRL